MYQQLHDPAFLAVASGSTPSLDLFFSATKALDSRITFTRASSATFVNSSGLIQTAATNVPRFTHDPVTGQSLGLLIEESRTNLLLRSAEFDNAIWSKSAVTVTQNAAVAPDGASTADKIVETAANADHYIAQNATTGLASNTYSVYLKAAERTWAIINAFDTAQRRVWVNLANGSLGNVDSGVTATIQALANGWYRVTSTRTSTSTAPLFAVSPATGNGASSTYLGDGTSGILVWGAQLEAGAFATSYIPTTTASATRAADVATITGTNFSSWFRQDEGTFVCGFRRGASASWFEIFEANDGTISNRIASRLSAIGESSLRLVGPGVNIDTTGSTTVALGSSAVTAIGYATGNTALVFQGVVQVQSGLGLPVGLAQLRIGSGSAGCPNSPIARIRYFRRRLPNSMLQVLTA